MGHAILTLTNNIPTISRPRPPSLIERRSKDFATHIPNNLNGLTFSSEAVHCCDLPLNPFYIMGAEDGTRTRDPRITNALLYQLSHFGKIALKKRVQR